MEVAINRLITAWIGGYDTPYKLTRLFYPQVNPDTPDFDKLRANFATMTNNSEFAAKVQKARRDTVGTVIQDIKETAASYKVEADKIAFGSGDDNVRAGMLKYLLKIGGFEPTKKITLFTPKDYEDKLERDFGEEDEQVP